MRRTLCGIALAFNAFQNYSRMHSPAMDGRTLLSALMARDGDNPSSLAKKMGKDGPSQPQIHKFLTGKAKEPRRPTLMPLAEHYGISVEAFYDPDIAEQTAKAHGLGIGLVRPSLVNGIAPRAASPKVPANSDEVVRQLARLLGEVNLTARRGVMVFLASLVDEPDNVDEVCEHVRNVLRTAKPRLA